MKNIIADENLVSLFKSLVPSEVPNLTLVQLEMLDHRGDRSKYPGLARVLELPVSQDPVIMLAFS
ncbi:MAG TPA: hypothetical protein VEA59_03525, partial [Patescibacteria group bacterium]|nr:hypothetical protein [Patescibacteria group bacterium]